MIMILLFTENTRNGVKGGSDLKQLPSITNAALLHPRVNLLLAVALTDSLVRDRFWETQPAFAIDNGMSWGVGVKDKGSLDCVSGRDKEIGGSSAEVEYVYVCHIS